MRCGARRTASRPLPGEVAQFFRAPAGLRNPFLAPVLARQNLRLVSWTRRGFDTVNADPQRILARLTRELRRARHPAAARRARGAHEPPAPRSFSRCCPRLLDTLAAARLTPLTLRAAFALAERA